MKRKMTCTLHNNQIDRFCISQGCQQKQSAMCIECFQVHKHQESISVKSQIIEKYLKIQKKEGYNKQQQRFLNQLMQTLAFIETNIKNLLIRTISNIFYRFRNDLKTYEKLDQIVQESLYKKNAQQIKKIYEYGKQKQKLKSNKQLNPRIIQYVLEYKVVLKQLVQKIKDIFTVSNFFQYIDSHSSYQNIQKSKDYSIQKIQALIKLIQIPQISSNKQQTIKLLKQVKSKNQSKNFKEAILQSDKGLLINPIHQTLYFQKAFALFQLKQFQKSYINYSICIQLGSSIDIAYNNRGLCLNSLKLYNEAIASFQKSIKANKKYPNPYMNKGISYQYLDKLQEALCCYDKALEIKQDYSNARTYKLQVENTIKNRKKNQ